MRPLLWGLGFFCVVFACFMTIAVAQDAGTATISGTVSSRKGGPISGAKVFITNKTTGQTTSVTTDAD